MRVSVQGEAEVRLNRFAEHALADQDRQRRGVQRDDLAWPVDHHVLAGGSSPRPLTGHSAAGHHPARTTPARPAAASPMTGSDPRRTSPARTGGSSAPARHADLGAVQVACRTAKIASRTGSGTRCPAHVAQPPVVRAAHHARPPVTRSPAFQRPLADPAQPEHPGVSGSRSRARPARRLSPCAGRSPAGRAPGRSPAGARPAPPGTGLRCGSRSRPPADAPAAAPATAAAVHQVFHVAGWRPRPAWNLGHRPESQTRQSRWCISAAIVVCSDLSAGRPRAWAEYDLPQ